MAHADEAEFRAAFERLYPRARSIAARIIGDDGLAHDCAAEALTRLYVRWWRLSGRSFMDAWVLRVTTNLALDQLRKQRRRTVATNDAAGRDPELVLIDKLVLADALAALPRRQREAVTLRYLGDMSESQVAALLGVSSGSVKTHLHRGIAGLRSSLNVASTEEAEARLAQH